MRKPIHIEKNWRRAYQVGMGRDNIGTERRKAWEPFRVFHLGVLRTAGVLLLVGGLAACSVVSRPIAAAGAAKLPKPWLTIEEIAQASRSPSVLVRDTVSSQGAMVDQPQRVTVADLVRYHGHPCDGLAVSAAGIAYGLGVLFPEGVVDRTDMLAATNASVCYGDVAAYLTGSRARYGTLIVDSKLGDAWILCRRSSNQCVEVKLIPGIKPADLAPLEARLRGEGCDASLMEQVQRLQKQFALSVLSSPPERSFTVRRLEAFPYDLGKGRGDTQKAFCGSAQVSRPSASGTPSP
jgi:formylmethanofuran dehydrogenase subunit E